ncbi:hypothetical protein NC652_018016 [Populus alba x Populus x berolinensis]|nr:hypothetical protein NC652_018016 [Populus alba x Populus x berolinensis]
MVGYEGWPLVINLIWLPPCNGQNYPGLYLLSSQNRFLCFIFLYIFIAGRFFFFLTSNR